MPAQVQIPAELEAVNAAVDIWFDEGVNATPNAKEAIFAIEDVMGNMRADRGKVKVAIVSQDANWGDYDTSDDVLNETPVPQGMSDVFSPTIHSYSYTLGETIWYIDYDALVVEDDEWGVYEEYSKNIGKRMRQRKRMYAAAKMGAASTALCYTGLSFFNAAQLVDPTNSSLGTFRNLWDLELSKTNFENLYGEMQGFVDESGQPEGNLPTVLVVSPKKLGLAREIAEIKTGQFGQENVNSGIVDVRVNPKWTGALSEQWDLYAAGDEKKPLGYAQKVPAAPVYIGEAMVNDKRKHRWMVRVRDRATYVAPRKAIRSIPAP